MKEYIKELIVDLDYLESATENISKKRAGEIRENIQKLAISIKNQHYGKFQSYLITIADNIFTESKVSLYYLGSLRIIVNTLNDMLLKRTKIFISHSSKDLKYIELFVSLLEKIGVRSDQLFCSSVQGYGIPIGENIYDYLRSEFANYSLFVIFMLSKNYYDSSACLNEMGASWALHNKYQTILLPEFSYNEINGAIDPRNICFRLNGEQSNVIGYLNELKDRIVTELELPSQSHTIWERHRNVFLNDINYIEKSAHYKMPDFL